MLGPTIHSDFEDMINLTLELEGIEGLKNFIERNKYQIVCKDDINCTFPTAALGWALNNNNILIVRHCLSFETYPYDYLEILMEKLAREGNVEMLKLLFEEASKRIKLYGKHANNLLCIAVMHEHYHVAALILDVYKKNNIISPEGGTCNAVDLAAVLGHLDILLLLMTHSYGLDYVKQNLTLLLSDNFPAIKKVMNGTSLQEQNFRSAFFNILLDSHFMASMTHTNMVLEEIPFPKELNRLIFSYALHDHLIPSKPEEMIVECNQKEQLFLTNRS